MTDIVERLRNVFPIGWEGEMRHKAADEIERLRTALENIVTMRPTIPQDEEGNGPDWQQYIYTRTWASFAADLQDVARDALKGDKR